MEGALKTIIYACSWRQLCLLSKGFHMWQTNSTNFGELAVLQRNHDDLGEKGALLLEEKEAARGVEEQNSRLLLSLLVVLSVLRLRSHSIMVRLSGFRTKAGKSRNALWLELSWVKQALLEYVGWVDEE